MTRNEYRKLAMWAASIPEDYPDTRLRHGVFGLASEAGEVAGILQKLYQGHTQHIAKECGACLWMIAEICSAIDIDLDTIMQMNIDKLKARYPDGFSSDRSLHREKGDI